MKPSKLQLAGITQVAVSKLIEEKQRARKVVVKKKLEQKNNKK